MKTITEEKGRIIFFLVEDLVELEEEYEMTQNYWNGARNRNKLLTCNNTRCDKLEGKLP